MMHVFVVRLCIPNLDFVDLSDLFGRYWALLSLLLLAYFALGVKIPRVICVFVVII